MKRSRREQSFQPLDGVFAAPRPGEELGEPELEAEATGFYIERSFDELYRIVEVLELVCENVGCPAQKLGPSLRLALSVSLLHEQPSELRPGTFLAVNLGQHLADANRLSA